MWAACFISIKNKHSQKDVRYYEEYSFPQILMEWIQKIRDTMEWLIKVHHIRIL